MHSLWIVLVTLFATSSLAASNDTAPSSTSPWAAVSSLKKAPDGHIHIADDGVVRSYDKNDAVIDHIPLNNEQLKQLLANLPEPWQKESDHLHALFDNVNGHDVVDKRQLLDPPAWLRRSADRDAAISPAPEARGKALLERQNYFCVGQPCTTSEACQFLGCSGCAYLDQVLPGGGGICAP